MGDGVDPHDLMSSPDPDLIQAFDQGEKRPLSPRSISAPPTTRTTTPPYHHYYNPPLLPPPGGRVALRPDQQFGQPSACYYRRFQPRYRWRCTGAAKPSLASGFVSKKTRECLHSSPRRGPCRSPRHFPRRNCPDCVPRARVPASQCSGFHVSIFHADGVPQHPSPGQCVLEMADFGRERANKPRPSKPRAAGLQMLLRPPVPGGDNAQTERVSCSYTNNSARFRTADSQKKEKVRQ